ncbi:MAG: right-handed parallel beta-helix repeat-containing protein [Vicinamibacterales bacterium]
MEDPPCNPITLLDGVYNERIVIAKVHAPSSTPLVINADHPFNSEDPEVGAFIDTGPAAPNPYMPRQAAIAIYDSSHVTIRGLHVSDDANQYCPVVSTASNSRCHNAGIDIRNLNQTNTPGPHHITIEGNEIFNVRAATVPSVKVSGALRDCFPSDPVPQAPSYEITDATCARRYDATPLDIYSDRDDASESTHHIVIRTNVIHNCDTNSDINGDPVIAVSRNVEHVLIEGNTIREIYATALEAGTPAITVRGEADNAMGVLALTDDLARAARARMVVIRDNFFYDIRGPALYVQSANTVLFERNEVHKTRDGVQVATETQPVGTPRPDSRGRHVWVRNNLFKDVEQFVVELGAVVPTYFPVDNIYVTNNTIANGPATSSILRYRIVLHQGIGGVSKLANNLVQLDWGMSSCLPGMVNLACDWFVLRDTSLSNPMAMVIDHNLWFVKAYPGFAALTWFCDLAAPTVADPSPSITCLPFAAGVANPSFQANGFDLHGHATDPLLASGYAPTAASPARNGGQTLAPEWAATPGVFGDYAAVSVEAGYPASFPELDILGAARTLGSAPDIGMREFVEN